MGNGPSKINNSLPKINKGPSTQCQSSFFNKQTPPIGGQEKQNQALFVLSLNYNQEPTKIRAETIKALIKMGANVNARDESEHTPLHIINWSNFEGYNETSLKEEPEGPLAFLLYKGADLNAQDDEGNTPLHNAVRDGDCEKARLLLAYNAKLSIKNNRDQTPLDVVNGLNNSNYESLEQYLDEAHSNTPTGP